MIIIIKVVIIVITTTIISGAPKHFLILSLKMILSWKT